MILSAFILSGCAARSVDKTLYDIESYIMERPDSALTILDTMDRRILKSERQRAHHALLHAMALDKNYIDVSDDSIARTAVEYYSKRGPEKYEARSLYYLGLAYYYQEKYDKAILEFTKAEEIAKKSDSLYWGFIKMGQADSYAKTHNDIEELRSIEDAYDICMNLKETYYINASKLRLAQALINLENYKKADSLLLELIETENNDIRIRLSAMVTYAFRNTLYDDVNHQKAINIYDTIIKEYNGLFMKNKDYWAWAYSLNQIDKKNESRTLISELIKNDTSATASYWLYLIAKSNKSDKEALKHLEEYDDKNTHAISSALRQSLATTQRNYYESQYELTQLKIKNRTQNLVIIIFIALCIIITFAWFVTRRIRLYNKEKEDHLKYAEDIKRQLEDARKEDYPELKRKYVALYKSKFEVIGALYEQYSMSFEKKNAEKAVYEKVAELMKDFKEDFDDNKNLENILNDGLDNIMTKLRSEMPKLKEMDYSVFCLIAIGFDVTTISYLLNVTMNTVYIRKSRMKQSIDAENPPHKTQFMELLN
ncbi:MAG: tetratricopeptide repeat protein [Alphaproteobacteria bacterium]|nr:tetratricopeptide repeat protein [Alphaproteobacteria bacterium]MBQ6996601.1 tetratricopeptide repeat protein [Lachnospiraceae bacterium]